MHHYPKHSKTTFLYLLKISISIYMYKSVSTMTTNTRTMSKCILKKSPDKFEVSRCLWHLLQLYLCCCSFFQLFVDELPSRKKKNVASNPRYQRIKPNPVSVSNPTRLVAATSARTWDGCLLPNCTCHHQLEATIHIEHDFITYMSLQNS